jgi:hypothetical protein
MFSWAINPTTFLIHKNIKIFVMSKRPSSPTSPTSVEEYVAENGPNLDSSQLSEAMAYSARHVFKLKDREIANDKKRKHKSYKYSVMLTKEMMHALKLFESSTLKVNDYGPFHWLTPMSSIEIFLVTTLEIYFKDYFGQRVFSKYEPMVLLLEKGLGKLSEHDRENYEQEIMQLKKYLLSLRTHRSIASSLKE